LNITGQLILGNVNLNTTTTNLLPPGTISQFAGPVSAIPLGWALCNGANISRSAYSVLFAVIGTSYGSGDGVTTFNLPDLRGKFARGVNNGSGNDPNAATRTACVFGGATGDNVGSCQSSDYASHSHSLTIFGRSINNAPAGTNVFYQQQNDYVNNLAYTTAASGGSTETRPINVNVHFIIYLGTLFSQSLTFNGNIGATTMNVALTTDLQGITTMRQPVNIGDTPPSTSLALGMLFIEGNSTFAALSSANYRSYAGLSLLNNATTTTHGASLNIYTQTNGLYNDLLITNSNLNSSIQESRMKIPTSNDYTYIYADRRSTFSSLLGLAVQGTYSASNTDLQGVTIDFTGKRKYALTIDSNSYLIFQDKTGAVNMAFFDTSSNFQLTTGSGYKPGGGSWSTYSDRRMKQNIVVVDREESRKVVENVQINRFEYREGYGQQGKVYIGPIAQDVNEYCPEAITQDPQGMLTFDGNWLLMHGLNAIRSLLEENRQIRKELDELRRMILLKGEL
jgi:microcystin-dependent protein